jgi:hypothetical protein
MIIAMISIKPQIAVVRNVLKPRILNPLEKHCRINIAMTTPETVPIPPLALTPPRSATSIVWSKYAEP